MMISSTFLYLIACAMIGYIARNHKFGWVGWFLISLLCSPLIGGLCMFLIDLDPKPKSRLP